MVDFKKKLAKANGQKPTDPEAIYDSLDRASDKGPLRPAQVGVLKEWYARHRMLRDVIVKLHTGQGKTLIGLLMLQSRLNETSGSAGPALYLCPNNHLVQQTATQASQFGVRVMLPTPDLPPEFLDGKVMLVTSVQKLFNGLTKFGLGPRSVAVGSLVMDDAHACIESIRAKCSIQLPRKHAAYGKIVKMFGAALQFQGAGTFAELESKDPDALLPIPYWEWRDRHTEVSEILAAERESEELCFVWPLVKDRLADCSCVVSGTSLEIVPYLPPLDLFGSFAHAKHRVFMSATVSNDAFLVKGLRLQGGTIKAPLVYAGERWSGEKMVLVPSRMAEGDDGLDRATIVAEYGKPRRGRKYGCVVLTPSFRHTVDWAAAGATVAKTETIEAAVADLIAGSRDRTLVAANRYDGIDLPDDACRILILDSKPCGESLHDRYAELTRGNTQLTAIRTARIVEQGMGRSVRGEKDYCVVIVTGPDLVKAIRTQSGRQHLSAQTRMQIELGLQISDEAREDDILGRGMRPVEALDSLVKTCLNRDSEENAAWKQFYVEKMNSVVPIPTDTSVVDALEAELEAETAHLDGDHERATATIQRLIDARRPDAYERGWYLQEMARYTPNTVEANRLQITAHRMNNYLLKPRTGMQVETIAVVSHGRIARIKRWLAGFEDSDEMSVAVDGMLSHLVFGGGADTFEAAFHEVGQALGFECQRPDKQWGEGPDNLWGLEDGVFLLVEAKTEVDLTRVEINKVEAGQMNNSAGWFAGKYPGAEVTRIIVTPASSLGKGAAFNEEVFVMRPSDLRTLSFAVRRFFGEFRTANWKDLADDRIQSLLQTHGLAVESIRYKYSRPVKTR
jgi:replicative superfamily II helicase